MELCVRTPREATRVHAKTAGQAKTATKVLYNYILYNLVYNFIFLLSMSLNEKLFCTGKEENNVLLFFFLFLLHVVVCFYETLENIFIVDLSLSSISKHVFCYL